MGDPGRNQSPTPILAKPVCYCCYCPCARKRGLHLDELPHGLHAEGTDLPAVQVGVDHSLRPCENSQRQEGSESHRVLQAIKPKQAHATQTCTSPTLGPNRLRAAAVVHAMFCLLLRSLRRLRSSSYDPLGYVQVPPDINQESGNAEHRRANAQESAFERYPTTSAATASFGVLLRSCAH